MEEWRAIPGYEGYEVSSLGGVRRVAAGRGTRAGRLITPTPDAGGRLVFNASRNGKRKQFKVHVAVALAFIGPRPDGKEVAHWDGDQANNKLSNLLYATPVENNRHKARHGAQPLGEKIWNAALTEKAVKWLRENHGVIPQAEMARVLGVHVMTVNQAIHRRTWKHV